MQPDRQRIDLVIQYALLVAGEEDEYFDRQLGPIHLIKYVYLGDLAFAQRNKGDTYTGAVWRFYNFGPWSPVVHERISPAVLAIRAIESRYESKFEDKENWTRWSATDEIRLSDLERILPPTVTRQLKRDVHKFGKDTASLLDYVYRTKPMLLAAPNEELNFTAMQEEIPRVESRAESQLREEALSERKRKRLSQSMADLRARISSTKAKKSLVYPVKEPRYDEVYKEGLAWLDELAGPQFSPDEIVAEFSDEVWKSATRKAGDVP